MQDGADYACRKRQVEYRPHAAHDRPRQPERAVRIALRRFDAGQHVSYTGAALHEDPRHHPRADRHGRGGAARMGREKSARHHEDADHGRGRLELADDRLSVPHPAMLPRHRRRRRADPHLCRPCQGLSEQAGLYPRHRRERGDADGQPDADLRQFARLQGRGSPGLQGSRHRAQGRRSSDDLRRVCAPAAVRPRRSRLHAARGDRQVHRRWQYAARRQAAAQHQWRGTELHAFRHVRHVRAAGERAADARHRAGAGQGRQDFGLPRRRRHVRGIRHDYFYERD